MFDSQKSRLVEKNLSWIKAIVVIKVCGWLVSVFLLKH